MNNKAQQNLTELINCLSILETDTSLLYFSISKKVEIPLVRALFEEISFDSNKHSALLKGVGESIAHIKINEKECAKHDEVLKRVLKLQKEILKMKLITSDDLINLNGELKMLETEMSEEYHVFVQIKTLSALMNQVNQAYNVNLNDFKKVFMTIIEDEERHIERLETIKKIVTSKQQSDNAPIVRFQNPDAWYQLGSPQS